MSLVDYIEDLPIQKPYKATFIMEFVVTGIDEADAVHEALTKFEERMVEAMGTSNSWLEDFELKIKMIEDVVV